MRHQSPQLPGCASGAAWPPSLTAIYDLRTADTFLGCLSCSMNMVLSLHDTGISVSSVEGGQDSSMQTLWYHHLLFPVPNLSGLLVFKVFDGSLRKHKGKSP